MTTTVAEDVERAQGRMSRIAHHERLAESDQTKNWSIECGFDASARLKVHLDLQCAAPGVVWAGPEMARPPR